MNKKPEISYEGTIVQGGIVLEPCASGTGQFPPVQLLPRSKQLLPRTILPPNNSHLGKLSPVQLPPGKFPPELTQKIFETYSTTGKVSFLFFESFLLVSTKLSFWQEDWALGYHSMKFRHFPVIF